MKSELDLIVRKEGVFWRVIKSRFFAKGDLMTNNELESVKRYTAKNRMLILTEEKT